MMEEMGSGNVKGADTDEVDVHEPKGFDLEHIHMGNQ